MKFMKPITRSLFVRALMDFVIISQALNRCRIMEPNSMNNDASVVHGFNYSDFEQILHGVFKKIERYRQQSVARSKKPLFEEREKTRLNKGDMQKA